MQSEWQPRLGAVPGADAIHFRVWAPEAQHIDVVVEPDGGDPLVLPLRKTDDGCFADSLTQVRVGDLYRYRVDGSGPFPDPASRYQPLGVHGPSQVIDPRGFHWPNDGWSGLAREDAIILELHVGTFTPEGTFDGVTRRLSQLVDLGVTAIELMPIADFPGERNWGYDGVSLFAPARCYGRPDDLRRLVLTAHRLGLAVLLDVVYNHLGPDGNYLRAFSPHYFTDRHQTPWGDSLNFDGPQSAEVRAFFIENALHWFHEYRIDGLRLDATHAIADDSPWHFLAELTDYVRASIEDRQILLIAEDHRNLAHMVQPTATGGWGLDGVWADDFHHQTRRLLAGDREGYYRDFTGTTLDLATTIRAGWFYHGQYSQHLEENRGTDPRPLDPRSLVVCIQNHDQIGNRALGERLHHQIDPAAYRAASALLLGVPQTPLLFMGQEWACSSPFLYFTHHHEELGRMVTEGRRGEFRHFKAFSDPEAQARIPDPQSPITVYRSKLDWAESEREPCASMRRLYQALIRLRRSEPALRHGERGTFEVEALDADTILLRRQAPQGNPLLLIVRLRGAGTVDLQGSPLARRRDGCEWTVLLTTEDVPFSPTPQPPIITLAEAEPRIQFFGPSAVYLRETACK